MPSPSFRRLLSTTTSRTPLLNIQNAHIYQFGSVKPVYENALTWTIASDGEAWAVLGDGKQTLLDALRGRLRISPAAPSGLWPLLSEQPPGEDAFNQIAYASFATRRQVIAGGGGFYDFTARYGGVREEDRITLRQSLEATAHEEHGDVEGDAMEMLDHLTTRLEIAKFLDLPLIALSNGQTRRAHVVRQLLKRPKVLLLDEPLTGLDVHNRPLLLRILRELHESHHPRVLLGLRKQDTIPEWITHVAIAQGSRVEIGPKDEIVKDVQVAGSTPQLDVPVRSHHHDDEEAAIARPSVMEAKGLNVRYHERHVLKDINWVIREGDRWHLQGANGSGKTTLLSMITGDHPQSYFQPHLHLFGTPRRKLATIQLQQQIGFVSPELFNAFPRRMGASGLTVRDAIGTGLHATFAYRPRSAEDDARIDACMRKLGPERAWDPATKNDEYGKRLFASLPVGEQSMVLLMRAVVSGAKLVILDEAFAGMNDAMVDAARRYLREDIRDDQAVVFVTHWEQEVPWPNVRKIALKDGHATSL